MTQARVWDFGALLTQARTKTLAAGLFTPGLYRGFEPTIVNATTIDLAPGSYLLPNGVMVTESGATRVVVPTPASPETYTVTADHDDIAAVGGSPAVYTLRSGILGKYGVPLPNSVALLWIRHPGSTPLASPMLVTPPSLQAESFLSLLEQGFVAAPFPQAVDIVKGANVTPALVTHSSGPEVPGLRLQNSSGLQSYQFRLPLPQRQIRYIDVFADIPALGSISLSTAPYETYDLDGNVVSLTPSSVSGPVTALDPRSAPALTAEVGNVEAPLASLGVTVSIPAATAGVFIRGFGFRSG